MLKQVLLPVMVFMAGCTFHDPNDVASRLSHEFDKGEKLMNACAKNENRCPAYYEFKRQWEADFANYTTFEAALAKHKARKASGLAV